jgi:putative spermidine/putrescine transport system substrate-binding protein
MTKHVVRAGAILCATATAVLVSGCSVPSGGSGGGKAKSVVMVSTGGDLQTCLTSRIWDKFKAKAGITVVPGQQQSDGQIQAMVTASNYPVDVVFPSAALSAGESASKYLQPIDFTKVDKSLLVPGTYTDYAVSQDLYSWIVGYRTDKFGGRTPTGWADFFDTTKFPGKRALPGDVDIYGVIAAALMADGVAPAKLIPLDVNRAIRKLNSIKSNIVWYGTGSQGSDLLTSGEVTMGMEYNNRVTAAAAAGSPVAPIWSGQILTGDLIGVAKGDPRGADAMDLIAYLTSASVNGQFSYCAPLAPTNTKAVPDPKSANSLPTAHLGQGYLVETSPEMSAYLAGHKDAITTAFKNWRSS